MPSQTKYASTVSVWSAQDVAWTNLNNILADDGNYASITLSSQTGDYVYIRSFGFSIPDSPTTLHISGILVEAEGYRTGSSHQAHVQILKDSDHLYGSSEELVPSSESVFSFGSSVTVWNHPNWTADEINGSGFGAIFWLSSTTTTDYIDFIRITVYYNNAPYTPTSAPTCNESSPTYNTRPTFSGTFSDPDSGDTGKLSFEVRTASGGGGTLEASGNSSSGIKEGNSGSWTPSSSLPNGTHYIRYKRVDNNNSSSGWSPDLTLDTQGVVEKSVQFKWNIRILAFKYLSVYWSIFSIYIRGARFKESLYKKVKYRSALPLTIIGKAISFLWNLRKLATKSLQSLWSVISFVSIDLNVFWNLRSITYKNLITVWKIFLSISKNVNLVWNIRTLISKTNAFLWDVAGFAVKELIAVWNTLVNVSKTRSLIWNVHISAIKSAQFLWNVNNLIAKLLQTIWSVSGWVGKNTNLLWHVLVSAGKTSSLIWNIRKLTSKTIELVWSLNQLVSQIIQLSWNVVGWVYKTLETIWNVFTGVGFAVFFSWNIRVLASKTINAIWKISGWVYKTLISIWKVLAGIQFLDINNILLDPLWLLSNIRQPANTVVINTFKIKNNLSSSITNAKITIHDHFAHGSPIPVSVSPLAAGNTSLSTGTWTPVGYINGNYIYLDLGDFTSGQVKTIDIKTQFNQVGSFYARLHFEALKGGTNVHVDQTICLTYSPIVTPKKPGEFRFKWLK